MKGTCAVPGCTTPARKRGWCDTHYRRWLTHGDPLAPKAKPGPKPARPCTYPGCTTMTRVGEGCTAHPDGWDVRCGDCLQLLGPLPKSGQPWALIEAHRCEEVA